MKSSPIRLWISPSFTPSPSATAGSISRNPSLISELVKKRIDADIQKYLQAKGLNYVASGKSDLNVRYTLGAVRKTEVEAYPAGWRGWGTRVVRVPYTEGTLAIDLRDPTTRSLVWRAIARE